MRKSTAAALTVTIALGACAAPMPSGPGDAGQCTVTFQRYDRELLSARRMPTTGVGMLRTADQPVGAETALRQYDCVSFERDLALEADLSAYARPAGQTPPEARYVHVGIVTSNAVASRVESRLSALGYPVVVKGAPRMGRRIFVGPLGSAEALGAAEGAATVLGFPGVYALDRLP